MKRGNLKENYCLVETDKAEANAGPREIERFKPISWIKTSRSRVTLVVSIKSQIIAPIINPNTVTNQKRMKRMEKGVTLSCAVNSFATPK